MSTTTRTDWAAVAESGQRGLDRFFGTDEPQLFNNSYPSTPDSNTTFNYWWLAHVIDVRLDAFERTGDASWLSAAQTAYLNILVRNKGSLFNDYFDDMLWYALAILRLHDATGDAGYLEDARAIWTHVYEHGWNDQFGQSVAWRKQQLHYKNTPANGPFVILSCRLSERTGDVGYRPIAIETFDWMSRTLVDPETGFVEDGINREEDGRIDTQWRFTYNQGLYVGAAVELFRTTGDVAYLDTAARTALTAINELSSDGVFRAEGDGGDEGLFKGVYYRYVGQLIDQLPSGSAAELALSAFVRSSTDVLRDSSLRGDELLAGNDWTQPRSGLVSYSTQLSAIMALELRSRLERH